MPTEYALCSRERPDRCTRVDAPETGSRYKTLERCPERTDLGSRSGQTLRDAARRSTPKPREYARPLRPSDAGCDGLPRQARSRARPPPEYISSKTGDSSASARSANCLMTRSGWLRGTRSSRSTNANIVAWVCRRPRIHATFPAGGSTVSAYPTSPEEPSLTGVGVFPRPARAVRRSPPRGVALDQAPCQPLVQPAR